jgi:hypothetical protein
MNRKVLINSAAVLVLLVAVSTIFVSSAYAGPDGPGTPPPPKPKTTPDPTGDDGGDSGDNKKSTSIITQIFKVMFDSSTMKDAIVNSIDSIFDDAVGNITASSSPFYKMGSEIFETDKLSEVRKTSWLQLRKVAFALLPLTAALTIWASMKDGLYSVTGYATTFEAVAEFFVSIAIALASFWLMEQAISLIKILTRWPSQNLSRSTSQEAFMPAC